MSQDTQPEYASLRIEEGIAYICIDVADKSVNTLSTPMTGRFEEILDELQDTPPIEGVVIYSGKAGHFVVGFDINELQELANNPQDILPMLKRGHALAARLESLKVPVVAAIDGTCLGGGLELAMACHARIVTNNKRSKLGLPEVQLGVIPGLGGTQRLPQLVGLQTGLDMILGSKQVDAQKAKRLGLVDDVVHPGILLQVAAETARKLYAAGDWQERHKSSISEYFSNPAEMVNLAAKTPARKLIFNQARELTRKKAGSHYPAPFRAIDAIEAGYRGGFEAGIEAESRAFDELVKTDVARNLINLFFMKQEVDKTSPIPWNTKAYPVDKIGVVGAGLMGAGIAQVAAYQGYAVRIKDVSDESIGRGLQYCKDLIDKLVRRKKISEPMGDVMFGHISGTTEYTGFAQTQMVIEAVFEDLDLKKSIIKDLEERLGDNAIVASNTSTLPITELAKASKRPENLLGMHFFSPVHKMPLLEIIRHPKTSSKAVATALEVGRKMGKTCIVVNDGPGFFTSRVIGAYINEAGWILQEGASIEAIDKAMTDWGFPVGPMKLVDEVGLDVALKAAGTLQDAFSKRWSSPTALKAVAADGRKGRKNKKGFYRYASGEADAVDETVYDLLPGGRERQDIDASVIQQRCWLAMLNECAYCLQEGIVEHPRDIDIGVIFGLGFPPFRGGILRHADSVGLARVAADMTKLAEEFGSRLKPAQIIVDKAEKNASFYA
ncbi:3-hydroxyacyl-CoA dehydrogenase NAD-binding domain-containing protein [Bradymonas sediminis]|uniref:enoyl-CoA hydratase n=1 Tax=Bradymonas sediminis TaxID=1548548 RepID=A0A2Z4FG40_9DELT|nr:3-hydroxyacyl-CoA dehydrogenase NAD-binding domain-containing protein [Bradymonas sediminis]AWV87892.1 fatty acid oxidation complex subunit alpha FadJ [Bradymonas sediminis]TDP62907.1 3-hydroxyacyl-CoA dehydrogenase/enoyl-CoA hydratase/3-hydroxybutyryl-CoA epimerase [Bradymonas sediminis]